jgi:FkbM family methyltransferase
MKPDALVFDIGANIGQSAAQFVDAGAGRVISVEPCIENYLVLFRRPKVTPLLAAAWRRPDIINVRYAFNQPGWSSVQPVKWQEAYPDARWGSPQPVAAVTLDLLWETYGEPFLIKIDVEGSELEVLEGLSAKVEYLIFEFHGKFMDDALACLDRCRALGFTRAHYVRENLDLETVPTLTLNDFTPRFLNDAPEWGNITVT